MACNNDKEAQNNACTGKRSLNLNLFIPATWHRQPKDDRYTIVMISSAERVLGVKPLELS